MKTEEPKDWHHIIDKVDRLLDRFDAYLEKSSAPPRFDVSLFEKHLAFRWERRTVGGFLVPIEHPHLFDLDDLVGVDMAKEELTRNTSQFVAGYPANNVLLWGERGTGKSSCIKGLLKPFSPRGLRIIEVQKDDLLHLGDILRLVRATPWRFILFCDDLSFEEGEASYRELKAILEGGIEARPENVLLYATSNRRHLMPEPMNDNLGKEIHPEEAISEKLSLADRFGLALSFYSFSQDIYLSIVEHYAERLQLDIGRNELRGEALRWALFKGQRSGRSARQFIDDLAGRLALRNTSKTP
ncbi:MAG: ATP-binding protein [Geobacteraceae bacterium]|nr:ATP-binding protein [Geobacteraceae bacterium]